MLRHTASIFFAGLAAACTHPSMRPEASTTVWVPAPITQYADANRDGKVTRKEAQADPNLARNFAQYDANDDGVLDRAEFAQLEAGSRREMTTTTAIEAKERTRTYRRPMTLNRYGPDPQRPESE